MACVSLRMELKWGNVTASKRCCYSRNSENTAGICLLPWGLQFQLFCVLLIFPSIASVHCIPATQGLGVMWENVNYAERSGITLSCRRSVTFLTGAVLLRHGRDSFFSHRVSICKQGGFSPLCCGSWHTPLDYFFKFVVSGSSSLELVSKVALEEIFSLREYKINMTRIKTVKKTTSELKR